MSPGTGLAGPAFDTRYLIFPSFSRSCRLRGWPLFQGRSPVESGCKDTTIFQTTKIFFLFIFRPRHSEPVNQCNTKQKKIQKKGIRAADTPAKREKNALNPQKSHSFATKKSRHRCKTLTLRTIHVYKNAWSPEVERATQWNTTRCRRSAGHPPQVRRCFGPISPIFRFIFITLCLQYGKDYYLCKTKDNIWKPQRNC